jgi:hypothetical protein
MLTVSEATPLPSWALEIIADGIQDDDDDRRRRFRASHRVAGSAVAHGWSEIEIRNLLKDRDFATLVHLSASSGRQPRRKS